MRTSLVMPIRRLAVMGLAVVATAALFLTMHALKKRYHARQVQKASRELEDRLRRKWLPYGIGVVVVVTAAVLFTMYVATERLPVVAGQPDRPLKSGDSYQNPAGAPHDARSGAQGAKVIATYVVEKGKPLASPAD